MLADRRSFGGSEYSLEDVEQIVDFENIRSAQDGVHLGRYLMGFIDAILAARSAIATIGTRGSTFSKFAEATLHPCVDATDAIA